MREVRVKDVEKRKYPSKHYVSSSSWGVTYGGRSCEVWVHVCSSRDAASIHGYVRGALRAGVRDRGHLV